MVYTHFIAEPGNQETVFTSIIDAPRDLVFMAFIDPDLIPKWWGSTRFITSVEMLDLRPGGVWRYIHRDTYGHEYASHGVFHEITPPERLAFFFEFEGMPWHAYFEIITFEGQPDGKTKLTDRSIFKSVKERDQMLQSGMEEGAYETMDRLGELLVRA